jgi:ribosomal protein S18 acetylase RimI-like enzyme
MIREATKDDINPIINLWQEMMDFHIQRSALYEMKPDARNIYAGYIKDILKSPDYVVLVYEIEDKVVGYLTATESDDPPVYKKSTGIISELSVTEAHRNKGIGEELLREIEKIFQIYGIKRIECMVSDFNEVSKSFWHKNGYDPYNLVCVKLLR